MKRILLIGCFIPTLALAQTTKQLPATQGVQTQPQPQTPLAGSQFGLGVVTATKLTYPSGTTAAVCTVEGQSVRYADDGTTPTASVGTLIQVGSVVTIRLTDMTDTSNAQFIQTGATATLDCMYYR